MGKGKRRKRNMARRKIRSNIKKIKRRIIKQIMSRKVIVKRKKKTTQATKTSSNPKVIQKTNWPVFRGPTNL